MTNAWHPRFSSSGALARGFGEITVEGRQGKLVGTYPVWDGDVLYWMTPTDLLVREGISMAAQGNGPAAVRDGRWALRQTGNVRTSDGRSMLGVGVAWLDDGWLAVAGVDDRLYLLPPGGSALQATSFTHLIRVSAPHTGAAFVADRLGESGRREAWGWRNRATAPELLNVTHHEFEAITVSTPHGDWVLSYTGDGGLERILLRKWGDTKAHVVATQPTVRGPAAHYDPQTDSFRIAWCDDKGVGTIRSVSRTTAEANKSWPSDTIAIAPFPRKVWVAPFFSHSERYGTTPLNRHVGNAICVTGDERDPAVLWREFQRVTALGLPVIAMAAPLTLLPTHDLHVAWWVSGADIDQLGQVVTLAQKRRPQKPVIAYLDSDAWPVARPSWVTERVWPAVQAYRRAGETVETFRDRVARVLDRVQDYGRPLFLTPRFDDFNGTTTVGHAIEVMSLYEQWVRQFTVVGLMPFSDRRGRGIAVEPSLRVWAEAFLLASSRPLRTDYWRPDAEPPPPLLPDDDEDEDEDEDDDMPDNEDRLMSSPEAFELLTKPGGVGEYLATGKGAANLEELILKAWKQPIIWAVYRQLLVFGDERAAKRYIRDRAFKEDKTHWPGRDNLDPL